MNRRDRGHVIASPIAMSPWKPHGVAMARWRSWNSRITLGGSGIPASTQATPALKRTLIERPEAQVTGGEAASANSTRAFG
jgi:hypothetical protein